VGAFDLELFQAPGEPAVLQPGDRVDLAPESGWSLVVEVPELTALVGTDLRLLTGQAPAGATLSAQLFAQEPEIYAFEPFERPHTDVVGVAGPDGRFELRCPREASECAARYGLLTARRNAVDATLQWLARPQLSVGVSISEMTARATAGTRFTVVSHDAPGGPTSLDLVSRPVLSGSLPGWSLDLRQAYPIGLTEGHSFSVRTNASTAEIRIPPFGWTVDTLHDGVSGYGPPMHPVLALALTARGDASRPELAYGYDVADERGFWQIRFEDYDFRPGDDLDLYVGYDGFYLFWLDQSVDGSEPEPGLIYLPAASRP
jgi:hypothetical protein